MGARTKLLGLCSAGLLVLVLALWFGRGLIFSFALGTHHPQLQSFGKKGFETLGAGDPRNLMFLEDVVRSHRHHRYLGRLPTDEKTKCLEALGQLMVSNLSHKEKTQWLSPWVKRGDLRAGIFQRLDFGNEAHKTGTGPLVSLRLNLRIRFDSNTNTCTHLEVWNPHSQAYESILGGGSSGSF